MDKDEIKKLLESGKVVIGAKQAVKLLRSGLVQSVIVAQNCSSPIRDDVNRLASLSDVAVIEVSMSNDELGVLCKKPFSISVLGVRK